jgi:predicted RNase H-like HicB family nuclease
MDAIRYAIVVAWSHDARAWVAWAPDVTDSRCEGATAAAAVAKVEAALGIWIAAARISGEAIPLPVFRIPVP